MTTGERIRELLSKQNISANQLAEKAGISSGGISKIINDASKPSAAVIGKIATTLNTSTDYLILGNETDKNNIETQLLRFFQELTHDNKTEAVKYITELWMNQNKPK